MTRWHRAHVPGGTFFFTLVTYDRAPILTTPLARSLLRQVTLECRNKWPFEIVAVVLLPDHLHTLWQLPDGDSDYSKRWGWTKKEFTKRWLDAGGAEGRMSQSRQRSRRRGVWQRKFWEHAIRDQHDLDRHLDSPGGKSGLGAVLHRRLARRCRGRSLRLRAAARSALRSFR